MINILLYLAYFLAIIATAGAILMPIINAIGQPKILVKTVGGIIVLLVLFLISYGLSGNEVLSSYIATNKDMSAGLSKFVGGSLTLTYIVGFIAIVGIVFSEVYNAIK